MFKVFLAVFILIVVLIDMNKAPSFSNKCFSKACEQGKLYDGAKKKGSSMFKHDGAAYYPLSPMNGLGGGLSGMGL